MNHTDSARTLPRERRPRPDGPIGIQTNTTTTLSSDPERGLYIVVVVDHLPDTVESYGPLRADNAVHVVLDLRSLLFTQGIEQVSVTTTRLHPPELPRTPTIP